MAGEVSEGGVLLLDGEGSAQVEAPWESASGHFGADVSRRGSATSCEKARMGRAERVA